MLLTITTTHEPASDLGFLLHKHPGKVHTFEFPFGLAHVFYPEATHERCTVALALEVDPIQLSRTKGFRGSSPLEPYVNDRAYAATSFLSVAIANVFGTAMTGRSKERQALAEQEIELETRVACLPCRRGEGLVERLFEPLGYTVESDTFALDEHFPHWGESPYRNVTLRGRVRVADLLAHLYVLIPVLDDKKHYFVGEAEVEKLLRHGGEWLALHPERKLITQRYLKHKRELTRKYAELSDEAGHVVDEVRELAREEAEHALERPMMLNDARIEAVMGVVRSVRPERIVDLGCGEGRLLAELLREGSIREIVGVDVSPSALNRAEDRLGLQRAGEIVRERVRLIHGSLVYRDQRLSDFDCALLIEVVEHVDPDRLPFLERSVFGHACPRTVVVTTPNREYNTLFERLNSTGFRHPDHRFEWTRTEFESWAAGLCARFHYRVAFLGIGLPHAQLGAPTQMAVFQRGEGNT